MATKIKLTKYFSQRIINATTVSNDVSKCLCNAVGGSCHFHSHSITIMHVASFPFHKSILRQQPPSISLYIQQTLSNSSIVKLMQSHAARTSKIARSFFIIYYINSRIPCVCVSVRVCVCNLRDIRNGRS